MTKQELFKKLTIWFYNHGYDNLNIRITEVQGDWLIDLGNGVIMQHWPKTIDDYLPYKALNQYIDYMIAMELVK